MALADLLALVLTYHHVLAALALAGLTSTSSSSSSRSVWPLRLYRAVVGSGSLGLGLGQGLRVFTAAAVAGKSHSASASVQDMDAMYGTSSPSVVMRPSSAAEKRCRLELLSSLSAQPGHEAWEGCHRLLAYWRSLWKEDSADGAHAPLFKHYYRL